jgi:hypothetical protein
VFPSASNCFSAEHVQIVKSFAAWSNKARSSGISVEAAKHSSIHTTTRARIAGRVVRSLRSIKLLRDGYTRVHESKKDKIAKTWEAPVPGDGNIGHNVSSALEKHSSIPRFFGDFEYRTEA